MKDEHRLPPILSNHGCRLNGYESDAMEAMAKSAGLENVVIVNSCAVTSEAVRKVKRDLRSLRRQHPEAKIILTGCAAEAERERFTEMHEVDFLLGNQAKMQPESWAALAQGLEHARKILPNENIMKQMEPIKAPPIAPQKRARAYLQIQNGCDHRCTFCIIPYGRGNSRSLPVRDAVMQAAKIMEQGHSEIVLTGVDLTSWGADLPGEPKLGSLVQLLLHELPDLRRLRLSSIDSIEADPTLMKTLAEEERLMPHLHLSLQAGDNMILKRMKRRHSREDAIRFCKEARLLRPDIVFGADLIAGFPTESHEMFQRSLDLVDECGLGYLHVFPYSVRPGTPAARMPQLEGSLIKERASTLRQKGEAAQIKMLESQIGTRQDALIERAGRGRTGQFAEVLVEGKYEIGEIVPIRVTARDGMHLIGVP